MLGRKLQGWTVHQLPTWTTLSLQSKEEKIETYHTAWLVTPSCTRLALVGLVVSLQCSQAQSSLSALPSRKGLTHPSLSLPPPTLLPDKELLIQKFDMVITTLPLVACQKYFGEPGQWPASFLLWPAMLLKALWSLLHSTCCQAHLTHVSHFFCSPLNRLQFLLWNSNQLEESYSAQASAKLLQLRILKKCRRSKTMLLTKTVHLCHQQMSQCTGPPIQRFGPVDMIPCYQFVFRLKNIPLNVHINKNILFWECSTLQLSLAERQARLEVDSDLALVSICKSEFEIKVITIGYLNVSSKPYPEAASGLVAGGWTLASPCRSVSPHET